jgi:hypothetical protein
MKAWFPRERGEPGLARRVSYRDDTPGLEVRRRRRGLRGRDEGSQLVVGNRPRAEPAHGTVRQLEVQDSAADPQRHVWIAITMRGGRSRNAGRYVEPGGHCRWPVLRDAGVYPSAVKLRTRQMSTIPMYLLENAPLACGGAVQLDRGADDLAAEPGQQGA